MLLLNFVAFVIFKILLNLASMQIFKMQITADISKIRKTVQGDLIFIFDARFGSVIGFVSFLVP